MEGLWCGQGPRAGAQSEVQREAGAGPCARAEQGAFPTAARGESRLRVRSFSAKPPADTFKFLMCLTETPYGQVSYLPHAFLLGFS